MRDVLKFVKKKVDALKGIFFLLYRIVMERLFLLKNLSEKSLRTAISPISRWEDCVFSIQISIE